MTGLTYKARVQETASNKPNAATAFNLPDSATAPNRSFDAAHASGDVVSYHATNGTDWEDGIGTFTAGTPDTLSRNKLQESSTGSFIDFSAGADVVVSEVMQASIAGQMDLALRAAVPGGRLTLASGDPEYQPINIIAVSGQDASADTITVSNHGWTVGTMVKSSATSGGLVAGTQYYAGNITTNTISLHTTLAAALAGTSKVNITGAVTANITANGVANTSIYYTPFNHNLISLWNGYRWQVVEFAETELALGTLTANKPYDVYAYINAGVLALELLAWTNDTTRATAITRQDGRWCKSGDKTRLLLGTLYTRDTTSTENSRSKKYLVNIYNKLMFIMTIRDAAASWTYSTAAWRQANGNSENQCDFIVPLSALEHPVIRLDASNSTSTYRSIYLAPALDSAAYTSGDFVRAYVNNNAFYGKYALSAIKIGVGKHFISLSEYAGGSGDTITWSNNVTYGEMASFEGEY